MNSEKCIDSLQLALDEILYYPFDSYSEISGGIYKNID